MKLCVKKIYCPSCQRLVKCQEQTVNGKVHILCSRCSQPLWTWENINWRYLGETTKIRGTEGKGS